MTLLKSHTTTHLKYWENVISASLRHQNISFSSKWPSKIKLYLQRCVRNQLSSLPAPGLWQCSVKSILHCRAEHRNFQAQNLNRVGPAAKTFSGEVHSKGATQQDKDNKITSELHKSCWSSVLQSLDSRFWSHQSTTQGVLNINPKTSEVSAYSWVFLFHICHGLCLPG